MKKSAVLYLVDASYGTLKTLMQKWTCNINCNKIVFEKGHKATDLHWNKGWKIYGYVNYVIFVKLWHFVKMKYCKRGRRTPKHNCWQILWKLCKKIHCSLSWRNMTLLRILHLILILNKEKKKNSHITCFVAVLFLISIIIPSRIIFTRFFFISVHATSSSKRKKEKIKKRNLITAHVVLSGMKKTKLGMHRKKRRRDRQRENEKREI